MPVSACRQREPLPSSVNGSSTRTAPAASCTAAGRTGWTPLIAPTIVRISASVRVRRDSARSPSTSSPAAKRDHAGLGADDALGHDVEGGERQRDVAQPARAALEEQQHFLSGDVARRAGDEHLVDADPPAQLADLDDRFVDAGQIFEDGEARDRVDAVVVARLGPHAEDAAVDDAAGERDEVAVGAIRHRGRRCRHRRRPEGREHEGGGSQGEPSRGPGARGEGCAEGSAS